MDKQFAITDALCEYGKISNNLEKHGDEEVTAFALPFASVMIDADTAAAIAGDKDFWRSVFNDNKGFLEPMPWVRAPISFPEKYAAAVAAITLPTDETLTFEECRIDAIEVMPTAGGLCELKFQLQITPGIGRENLLLQEYQHHKGIRLVIEDAKIALKKDKKQRQLELVGGGAKEGEPTTDEIEAASDESAEAGRDALDDADRLLTKLAELGMRPGIEAAGWTERERAVAWEWALAYEADGENCKIARPHWLPIPELAEGEGGEHQQDAAA